MIAILGCLIVMLLLQAATPFWWWIMLIPFAYGFGFSPTPGRAVRTGFVSAGLLWLGSGGYAFVSGSRTITVRMAAMFGLGNPWLLILATGLLAAVAAAVSAYAGYSVRRIIEKNARPTDSSSKT